MHKRQKQFNPSGIKWPAEVDMPWHQTQTEISKKKSHGSIKLPPLL